MQSERIKRGETFAFSATFEDADGAPVVVDDTWSFALRICKGGIGGEVFVDVPVTLTDGELSGTYDTEDMDAGVYYYDIRVTDPDGHNDWSAPVKLTIEPTNTPST